MLILDVNFGHQFWTSIMDVNFGHVLTFFWTLILGVSFRPYFLDLNCENLFLITFFSISLFRPPCLYTFFLSRLLVNAICTKHFSKSSFRPNDVCKIFLWKSKKLYFIEKKNRKTRRTNLAFLSSSGTLVVCLSVSCLIYLYIGFKKKVICTAVPIR